MRGAARNTRPFVSIVLTGGVKSGGKRRSARFNAPRRSMVCYAIFAASLRPAFQALQHQRQPERDAEADHVDTGGRLFELRGDVSPS
jgi:hypothetical protein